VFEFIWSSKNTISTETEMTEVPAILDAVTSL
jgi:hypothetical protein